jgi:hypothetical protein
MQQTEEPAMTEATVDHRVETPDHSSPGMLVVRYGLGAVMILGGIVVLIVSPASLGVDGFAMAVGGGLSVALISFMFRLSESSEDDRAEEERARVYFDEHGEWPEDKPRTGRKWVLPAGVVTYEMEQAQLKARSATGGAGEAAGPTESDSVA